MKILKKDTNKLWHLLAGLTKKYIGNPPYLLLLTLKNEVSVVGRIVKITYQEKEKGGSETKTSFIPKSSQLKSTIVPLPKYFDPYCLFLKK